MKTQKLILCIVLVGAVGICGLSDTSWALTLSQNILPSGYYTVIKFDGTVVFAGEKVSAGDYHSSSLEADGTVLAIGRDTFGNLAVNGWANIVQTSSSYSQTVGLKSNGKVMAVGGYEFSIINVESWTDIVQVAAAGNHTVGLKSNGTVVATGINDYNQLAVSGWTDIVQVSGGNWHTVGLKSDGTVVAAGPSGGASGDYDQCDVGGWTDIVQISAHAFSTVGLKADGTVVATGRNFCGELNVSGWTDIVQVEAGYYHTVGLKADGTVVAAGDVSSWPQIFGNGQCNVENGANGFSDIIQVSAGCYHTLGLKSDGTVVAAGPPDGYMYSPAYGRTGWGQTEVGDWMLAHTIRGYVTEYDKAGNGTKINGTQLSLAPNPDVMWPAFTFIPPLTTDGTGYYEKILYASGDYQITVSYSDYNVSPHSFIVGSGLSNPYDVDFGLYTIDGYVKRYGTSEGINGVNVTVTGGSSPIAPTTTDGPSGPGYYEAHVGHVGSRQYTVTPSNP